MLPGRYSAVWTVEEREKGLACATACVWALGAREVQRGLRFKNGNLSLSAYGWHLSWKSGERKVRLLVGCLWVRGLSVLGAEALIATKQW